MAATHMVIYDNTSGYVHQINYLVTDGAWSNSGTYLTDDYIQMATAGKVWQGFGSNMRAVELTNPTFDHTDWAEFGVLEVDVPGAPTDTQERTDGSKMPGGTGVNNGDTVEYTYA